MNKKKVRGIIKEIVIPSVMDIGLTAIEYVVGSAIISNIDEPFINEMNSFAEKHKVASALITGSTAFAAAGINWKICDKISEPFQEVYENVMTVIDFKKLIRLHDNGYSPEQIAVVCQIPEKDVREYIFHLEKDRENRKKVKES